MLKRTCDANHCAVPTDASKGMCPHHWSMVPLAIQRRIWAAARKHRTSAERLSSVEFLEAWADAVELVAMQEGRLTRNAYRNLANWVRCRRMGMAERGAAQPVESYVEVIVRAKLGTYETSTLRKQRASCTAGEQQAAEALGRKVFGAAFLRVEPFKPATIQHGVTYWHICHHDTEAS